MWLCEKLFVFAGNFHCAKNVRIRGYSGPCSPSLGMNTERYGVTFRIQSKFGKIHNNDSEYGHFSRSVKSSA